MRSNVYNDNNTELKPNASAAEDNFAKTDECLAEIVTIGSSCSVPTPERGLPCTLVSVGRVKLVFDYGDGATQKLLRFVDFGHDEIFIFFTHDHPDHWTGILALPGIIYTMLIEKMPIKKIHMYANPHIANSLVKFLKSSRLYDELRKYFEINYISKDGSCLDDYPNHDTHIKTDAALNRAIKSFSEGKRKASTPEGLDCKKPESTTTNMTLNIKNLNNVNDFVSVKWSPVLHVSSSLAFRVNVGKLLFPANLESYANYETDQSATPEIENHCSIGITGDTKYIPHMNDFFLSCSALVCDCTFSKRLPNKTKSKHMSIEQACQLCRMAKIKLLIATHLHTNFSETSQDKGYIQELKAIWNNFPLIEIGADSSVYRVKR
jgi:ribonuclease BN (tRNA processing enzyme)